MTWWKRLIYPFVWLAVMVVIGILKLCIWLEKRIVGLPDWEPIPMRWEIIGIQKDRIFMKEV